jgi:predicted site-specific integrase-resolvase
MRRVNRVAQGDDMLTLEEAEEQYGVKRATLYRYVQHGSLRIYRRAMDKRAYVRRADLEALRRFRESERRGGPTLSSVERARAFQRRVFGERILTPTAELIEEGRRERTQELP